MLLVAQKPHAAQAGVTSGEETAQPTPLSDFENSGNPKPRVRIWRVAALAVSMIAIAAMDFCFSYIKSF